MIHTFIAHAQNGHISIFGIKFDVIIVFLDPDVLHDARTLAIHKHSRQI